MGLLKSTSTLNKSDGSNPIIISPSGDTDKLNSNEMTNTGHRVIGDKVSGKLNDLSVGNSITYPVNDDTIIHQSGNQNKNSESKNTISHVIGNANKNTEMNNKTVKIVDQKGILTDTDGVGVEKVVTYPKYEDTKVKALGNTSNVLSSLIKSDDSIKKVDGDTSPLSTSLSEAELLNNYEKTLSKVIGYSSSEVNATDLTNAMTRLADEASKLVKVSGSEDVRNYLRTTLNTVGLLTTPLITKSSGVTEVIKILKSYGGDLSVSKDIDALDEAHILINSAITRSYIKKINLNNNSLGNNFKGFGISTNKSSIEGIPLSNLPSSAIPLVNIGLDYASYKSIQNEYMLNHFDGLVNSPLMTRSVDFGIIHPDVSPPLYNAELAALGMFSANDRRDFVDLGRSNDGLFVAYDQALWDFYIIPYGSILDGNDPPPKSPFDFFFPAVDVSIDDVDTNNSTSIQLPWDMSINLPGSKNIPTNITVRVYENQYMIIDKWLRDVMNHIYVPDGKGAYRLATFKDSSYLVKYYFLDPQLRAIKRLQYLVIPEFNFKYNGSESSALQDYSINFTIVGSDHY